MNLEFKKFSYANISFVKPTIFVTVWLILLICLSTSFGQQSKTSKTDTTTSSKEVDERPIVVNTDLVNVVVTVIDDNGRYVTGLSKDSFTLYDDKVPQEIKFFSDTDEPVSVAIVLDTSSSMSGDKIQLVREAVSRFIENSHPKDEYFLIEFNSQARLLMTGTSDTEALLEKVSNLQPRGQTALLDAVFLGVEAVTRGRYDRRAVIVLSDGEDNHSRYNLKELKNFLKETGVFVYTVGFHQGKIPGSMSYQYDHMTMEELSIPTGGRAFFPWDDFEIVEAFEQIALELRHQYSLAFTPSELRGNGKWHRIKVKVSRTTTVRKASVRHRNGYYDFLTPM